MKPFHPAVLAAIAWILIFPRDMGRRMPPLYEWEGGARYDTAERCEQGRQQLTEEASRILKGQPATASEPFAALIVGSPLQKTANRSRFLYARCVSSDDPELKSPFPVRSPSGHETPFPLR
jgi:hypothetical protein